MSPTWALKVIWCYIATTISNHGFGSFTCECWSRTGSQWFLEVLYIIYNPIVNLQRYSRSMTVKGMQRNFWCHRIQILEQCEASNPSVASIVLKSIDMDADYHFPKCFIQTSTLWITLQLVSEILCKTLLNWLYNLLQTLPFVTLIFLFQIIVLLNSLAKQQNFHSILTQGNSSLILRHRWGRIYQTICCRKISTCLLFWKSSTV